MAIHWLDPADPHAPFPPVERALREPDGLLAAGGDLATKRLIEAYRLGIFPWYEVGQPILWWSPDPRAVLYPEHLRITRSLRKTLRNRPWRVRFDTDFATTVGSCAAPRSQSAGTWITPQMMEAYCRLHAEGHAHSVEVYDQEGVLIGGLYGVAIGRVFFGESMFSRRPDASKLALVHLARHLQAWGYPLIDCQLASPHIMSLGAELIPRPRFIRQLKAACTSPGHAVPWRVDATLEIANWDPAAATNPSDARARKS
jgi:leucyl/phenylalanyl-tRNA--protein transferase